jgi:IMP dehydrogenase
MFKRAYTFDDVLLTPQYSTLKTRKGIDTSTKLVAGLHLKTPIVASNMDTVCESDMAIRMAEIGGIGIIHRYLSVEDQVAEVERVKTHLNFILSNPYTIHLHNSLEEAVDIMVEQNVSSLLVINDESQFSGILGLKDATYVPGTLDNYKVTDAMVALEDVITVSPTVTKSEALNLMQNQRIGKLPVLNEDGTIYGLITRKTLNRGELHLEATKDAKGRLAVGAAVGVTGDYLTRVKYLIRAGVDVLVLDIAHGHSIMSIEALKAIKAEYGIPVIAGNVATAQGAIELAQAGADGIKVGVGPGSICTTRIVTGHGVPQLTAILDACNSVDVPIIADGGIRKSGDIVKALAAGASTVMLGSLLAGTDESPGGVITRDGSRYKMIRGMASYGAALGRSKRAGDDVSEATPEGVEALIPYRGSVDEIITNLMGGVRSGFSYSGATCLAELWQNAEFVEISPAGLIESRHHDVKAL